jgi:hypothetical protein
VAGLGVLDAEVRRFPADGVSVPQMGWNQIWPLGASPLLDGVTAGAFVYFANSYYVTFPPGSVPLGAETRYGSTRFLSAVSLGRLHATQFHPEKSQAVGLRVLENFGAVVHAAARAAGRAGDAVTAPLRVAACCSAPGWSPSPRRRTTVGRCRRWRCATCARRRTRRPRCATPASRRSPSSP